MQAMLRLGGNKIARRLLLLAAAWRIPRATILTPKKSKNPLTCGRMHTAPFAPSVHRPPLGVLLMPDQEDITLDPHVCIYTRSKRNALPCSRQQQQTFIFRSSFFLSKRRPADAETRQAEKPTFVHNSFLSVRPLFLLKSTFSGCLRPKSISPFRK